MSELKYPQWQMPWIEAMSEVQTETIPQKVKAFEDAVEQRLRQLEQSRDGEEERTAIRWAVKCLKQVKG